jgi:type IV pilus assembly protein PilN
MQISLNLATRPFADLGPAIKRLRIAMGALALISIGLGIGLHFLHAKAEQARARDHSLDGSIARIAREKQHYTEMMHQPDNAELLAQSQALNQLFDQKSFSWTLAMEDLETVLPGGVQVTQIEPKIDKEGKITISLRVVGPRDREVDLVKNLEHSRRFLLPRIVGENAAETGEGANKQFEPVSASNRFNFDILADYNPAQPGERRPAKPAAAPSPASHTKVPDQRVRVLPVNPTQGQAPGFRPGRPPYTGPKLPLSPRPSPMVRPAPGMRPSPVVRPAPGTRPAPVVPPAPNAGGPQ